MRCGARVDSRSWAIWRSRAIVICVGLAIGWTGEDAITGRTANAASSIAIQEAASANAEVGWSVSILNDAFERIDGTIEQIDSAGVTVRASDGASSRIESKRVASIEAIDLASDRTIVRSIAGNGSDDTTWQEESESLWWISMKGGERLLGQPVAIDSDGGEQLLWRRGDVVIRLPLAQVREFWRATTSGSSDGATHRTTHRISDRASARSTDRVSGRSNGPAEDRVLLGNGEALNGIVDRMDESGVAVEGENGGNADWKDVVSVQLADLATIDDAPAGLTSQQTDHAGRAIWILETRRGERIRLESPVMQKGELSGQAFGEAFRYRAAELASLRPAAGSLRWLVDATPIEVEAESFFGEENRAEVKYASAALRTIAVRARTVLSFEVGDAKQIRLSVSVPKEARRADVTARVWGDDALLHEARALTAGHVTDVIVIDVTGRKIVKLEADFGTRFGVDDELHWVDAALVR